MGRKIAMFGGSFNPIHNGHIQLANACIKELSLDKVFLIPTASTPLKDNSNMALPYQRFEMCKIACKDLKKIEVSDIEINRKGNSYTIDTLQQLKAENCDDKLYLIVGADMFLTLLNWKDPKDIFFLANIIVCQRNDKNHDSLFDFSKKLSKYGAKCHILSEKVITVSSTDIRSKIRCGKDVSDVIHPKVLDYINSNNLYRQ